MLWSFSRLLCGAIPEFSSSCKATQKRWWISITVTWINPAIFISFMRIVTDSSGHNKINKRNHTHLPMPHAKTIVIGVLSVVAALGLLVHFLNGDVSEFKTRVQSVTQTQYETFDAQELRNYRYCEIIPIWHKGLNGYAEVRKIALVVNSVPTNYHKSRRSLLRSDHF